MQGSHRWPLCAACLVLIAAAPVCASTEQPPSRISANDTLTLPVEDSAVDDARWVSSRAAVQEHMPLGPSTASIRSAKDEVETADPEADHAGSGVAGTLSRIDPRANDIVQVLAALAAVVGLILLTRMLLVRFGGTLAGGGRPSGVLEVLARFPIARGQQLILLKLGRRIVLTHSSGGAMRTLTEVTDGEEVAALLGRIEAGSSGREAMRFRSLLSQFQQEHDAVRSVSPRSVAPGNESREESEIVDLTRQRGRLFGWGRSVR